MKKRKLFWCLLTFALCCNYITSTAQQYRFNYTWGNGYHYYFPEDLENLYYWPRQFSWISHPVITTATNPLCLSGDGLDYWNVQLNNSNFIYNNQYDLNSDGYYDHNDIPLLDGEDYGILISFGSEGHSYWYDLGLFTYSSDGTGTLYGEEFTIYNIHEDANCIEHYLENYSGGDDPDEEELQNILFWSKCRMEAIEQPLFYTETDVQLLLYKLAN